MNNLKKFFKDLSKKEARTATILIMIGILVVINFLSYQIFIRFDLTANKDYSISKVSKKTARNLDDIVNIKAYFSKNLPAKFLNLTQEVKDILDEYANYSVGKIKVQFIDPSSGDDTKEELEKVGIPSLRFDILRNDSFEVVQGYMGMLIGYGDKQVIIPMISNTQNLEYDVTLSIKKLTSEETPVLGVLTSHGTAKIDTMTQAYSKLMELYRIKEVDLKGEEEKIAEDIETLLIVGPTEEFLEEDLKKIDDFVMSGKSLILLVDGVKVEQGLNVRKNEIGLEKFLDGYGLSLNKDLILDVSSGRASFSQGYLTFMVDYPLWPKVLTDNFDKENVMVANLGSLMLPWASSVGMSEKEGVSVSYLAKSTKDAWSQKDNYKLNPQENFRGQGETGQYNFALFARGKFESYFGEKEVEDGKIILVGDSDFILDMFLEQDADNLIFFQNIVDGLSLDEDLINIRSHGVTAKPIKPLKKTTKEIVRYANIFGLTILVLVFGLLRYFLRRRNKFNDNL